MVRASGRRNRIEVGDTKVGLSLPHAIILAEFGDTIVVHTDEQKAQGKELARRTKPNTKIDFIVEPVSHVR